MKRGKKRKGREREGEGGWMEKERAEDHVFLTFRMVEGRASAATDRRSAWVTIWAYHDRILFTTLR